MKLVKKTLLVAIAAGMCVGASAERKPIPEGYLPSSGDLAIGLSISPVSAFSAAAASGLLGDTIVGVGSSEYQMKFLSQDPMVSISMKYKLSDDLNFRASLGFSGIQANYREYCLDDAKRQLDAMSNAQVFDQVRMNHNAGMLQLGLEYAAGSRKLQFIMGASLFYAFGGSEILFNYGNAITEANWNPTVCSIAGQLNEWQKKPTSSTDYSLGEYAAGRPLKRYNVGIEHGFGLKADVGVEWFFIDRLSLEGRLRITPVFVGFQPQTYTTYEAWNKNTGKLDQNVNILVSPGSNYVTYGTDKLGFEIGLHYYF